MTKKHTPQETADLIISNDSWEHMEDDIQTMAESHNLLLQVMVQTRKDLMENFGAHYFNGEWPEINEAIRQARGQS